MAFLSTRVDGESQGTITANWYNDFMQVLTGVMNDQPIYIYYQPGAGTNPPALKIKTNGNAGLLQGLNSAGSQVFLVDASGNLTAAGTLYVGGNAELYSSGNDVHLQNTDGSGYLYLDFSNELHLTGGAHFDTSGNYYGSVYGNVTGTIYGANVYDNSNRVAVQGAHSNAGQPILSIGNGAPSSLSANEVYFQLS